jgi:hypothetical protein
MEGDPCLEPPRSAQDVADSGPRYCHRCRTDCARPSGWSSHRPDYRGLHGDVVPFRPSERQREVSCCQPSRARPCGDKRGRQQRNHRLNPSCRAPCSECLAQHSRSSPSSPLRACLKQTLAATRRSRNDQRIEPIISHVDVTTIMRLLGDLQADVRVIRNVLEGDDGEEEEVSENDA